jgi:hypothetical protein
MSDMYDEDDIYYNYGTQENGAFLVAGGGLGNGNAYATIEKRFDKYYYCEYGKYAYSRYVGENLKWIEKSPYWKQDGSGSFIIE